MLSTKIQLVGAGKEDGHPKHGVYGTYVDHDNYYVAMIDTTVCAGPGCVATDAVVNGADQGWQNCTLPSGFNPTAANLLVIEVANGTFSLAMNGSPLVGACQNRQFSFTAGQASTHGSNGQVGVVVDDTEAQYTNFNVSYGLPQDSGTFNQAYAFRNQASYMNLDNQCDGCGAKPAQDAQVIQYPTAAPYPLTISWTQRWTLKSKDNGYFSIVSAASGLCLDNLSGDSSSPVLKQISCNGGCTQNWQFIPVGNSNFVIQNQASSLVLDSVDTQQGTQIRLNSRAGSPSQQW